MAAEFPQSKMVILKGSDNPPITVEEFVAKQSPVIKTLIDRPNFNNNNDQPIIILPGNITSATLSKLMEYCKSHDKFPDLEDEYTSRVTSEAESSLRDACAVCWETMAACDTAPALKDKADPLKDIADSLEKAAKVFRRLSERAAVVGRIFELGQRLLNRWDANFVRDMDVGTLADVISAAECLGLERLSVLAVKTLSDRYEVGSSRGD